MNSHWIGIRRRGLAAAGCALVVLLPLLAGAGCSGGKLEEYSATLRDDFDADEREKAARKLGKLGDRDAVPALRAATADPADKVREAVAEALGRLGDRSAGPDLAALLRDPEKDVRREAVKALGLLGDEARVPDLLPLLSDRSSDIREETVEALGVIGSGHALEALRQVSLRDSDEDVRAKAAFAVRRIEAAVQ